MYQGHEGELNSLYPQPQINDYINAWKIHGDKLVAFNASKRNEVGERGGLNGGC